MYYNVFNYIKYIEVYNESKVENGLMDETGISVQSAMCVNDLFAFLHIEIIMGKTMNHPRDIVTHIKVQNGLQKCCDI